jgi:hypothetical protein
MADVLEYGKVAITMVWEQWCFTGVLVVLASGATWKVTRWLTKETRAVLDEQRKLLLQERQSLHDEFERKTKRLSETIKLQSDKAKAELEALAHEIERQITPGIVLSVYKNHLARMFERCQSLISSIEKATEQR